MKRGATPILAMLACLPGMLDTPVAHGQTSWTVSSPSGALELRLRVDGKVRYEVGFGGGSALLAGTIGCTLSDGRTMSALATATLQDEGGYSGSLETRIGEDDVRPDRYTRATLHAVDVMIRLYDEGYAFRYAAQDAVPFHLATDQTTVEVLQPGQFSFFSESGTESGYTERDAISTFNSLSPLFGYSPDVAITINEAANTSYKKMTMSAQGGVVKLVQSTTFDSQEMLTPWRYVAIGRTPVEMLGGKYIVQSLNEPAEGDYGWVEPGRMFRCMEASSGAFHTDTVLDRIDFAARNGFRYLLLDDGWYGLGYYSRSTKSNPMVAVGTLDIHRVVDYAASKGIGVIAYIDQWSWDGFGHEAVLDTMLSWGVSGIKLGFMRFSEAKDVRAVYDLVRGCAARRLVVDVHDAMRPTGCERTYPNLLTTEGVMGGEHWPDAYHDMLLPFTRYMTGSADYTIVFRGSNTDVFRGLQSLPCHQYALHLILFDPIQALLWYGRPVHYAGREDELEFFAECPTVFDETVVVGGEPGRHFEIARRAGRQWFVAAATGLEPYEAEVRLDFLDKGKVYTARLYEDNGSDSISVAQVEGLTSADSFTFSLEESDGVVAVIDETEEVVPTKIATEVASAAPRRGGVATVVCVGSGSELVGAELYDLGGRHRGAGRLGPGLYVLRGDRRLLLVK